MIITNTLQPIRDCVAQWRRAGETIALVPTMGNLHAGHISLIERAFARADRIVVSRPQDNFDSSFEADCVKLALYDIDVLFAPSEEVLFPLGRSLQSHVCVPSVADILCGEVCPGYFTEIATLITKLFHIVEPDIAVFGQKDYQQWLVISRMVSELNFPIKCVMAPIVREMDGLAMSTRNKYLSPDERAIAPALYNYLHKAAEFVREEGFNPNVITQISKELASYNLEVEYFTGRHQVDLSEPENGAMPDDLVILGAIRIGSIRLIDNILI